MDIQPDKQLEDLVAKHHVCWDVVPFQAYTKEGSHPVGYEIHLLGTHDEHQEEVMPGCPHCIAVYKDLQQIAKAVLPPSDRESTYHLSGFDSGLRFSTNLKLPPAVQIKIEIHHRSGWDGPIDECEDRCLTDITDALKQLGVTHRRWPNE